MALALVGNIVIILSALSATSAGEDTTFKKNLKGTFKLKCKQFLEHK